MLPKLLNKGLFSPWAEPGRLWPGGSSLTSSLSFQLVKQCVGTVTLDAVKGKMNITCEEVSGSFCTAGTGRVMGCGTSLGPKPPSPSRAEVVLVPWPLPPASPRSPAVVVSLKAVVL